MTENEELAQAMAAQLGDIENAVGAPEFPSDRGQADHAGMYAWFGDDDALATLTDVLEAPLTTLLYSGQAGATSTRSAKESKSTLLSRVRGQHIRGDIYGSTMRRTFAAVLREPLDLEMRDPKRLTDEGEARLRTWIERHLRVAIAPIDDRAALAHVEPLVLAILDPPLNLNHMPKTAIRRRVQRVAQSPADRCVVGRDRVTDADRYFGYGAETGRLGDRAMLR